MVNGKKNLKNCIARTRVESYDGNKFWRVYVWKTSKDLCEQVLHDDDGGCYACHCPMEFYENVITGAKRSHPVMGELHFVSGEWNIETVSHECCHAMMQFNEAHNLKDSQDDEYMTVEEQLCYFLGDLTRKVYRWLYEVNPWNTKELEFGKDRSGKRC